MFHIGSAYGKRLRFEIFTTRASGKYYIHTQDENMFNNI
jgi:hypothetical protein